LRNANVGTADPRKLRQTLSGGKITTGELGDQGKDCGIGRLNQAALLQPSALVDQNPFGSWAESGLHGGVISHFETDL
jgi:hypothetical protein